MPAYQTNRWWLTFSKPSGEFAALLPVIFRKIWCEGTVKVHGRPPFVRGWLPHIGPCKLWAYKTWTVKASGEFAEALRQEGVELIQEPLPGDADCDTNGAFKALCGLTVGRHNEKTREEFQLCAVWDDQEVNVPCVCYHYDEGECWEIGDPLKTRSAAKRQNAPVQAFLMPVAGPSNAGIVPAIQEVVRQPVDGNPVAQVLNHEFPPAEAGGAMSASAGGQHKFPVLKLDQADDDINGDHWRNLLPPSP